MVIPHLRDLSAAVIQRSLAHRSLIVPCAGAANVRRGAVLGAQSFLEVGEGVCGAVGWDDVVVGEPLVSVQAIVIHDHRLEELNDVLVFGVLWAVAGDVKCGKASGMLGELVLWFCQLWSAFLFHG